MDIYKEILIAALSSQNASVYFPDLHINPAAYIKMKCYTVLRKIKPVAEDETLTDVGRREQINAILADIHSMTPTGGNRRKYK